MGFLGVYTAIYDYAPQGEGELTISEGDTLYVLEKSGEDDWWKAKKKATGDDDDEPVGLIPNNYIEEAHPSHSARALYDYTRQTDEELSFTEDAQLEVFDTSDPDWILVGLDGEYGFAPANYIEVLEEHASTPAAAPAPPALPAHPPAAAERALPPPPQEEEEEEEEEEVREPSPEPPASPPRTPASALAGIIGGRQPRAVASPPPVLNVNTRPQYTPEVSDEDDAFSPALPTRPQARDRSSDGSGSLPRSPRSPGVNTSHPHNRMSQFRNMDEEMAHISPGGFHLYNINEMVSVMGKRKKMPTTLGINLATGTLMIAPSKARDGPQQEWTAEKMTHYSIEGKHVFLELVRPTKSVDFHAGAKDTAQEIVAALGDMAGAIRAEGLREVIAAGAGSGQKRGQVLYDFMAQGDDEVTVGVGDDVIILDDTKSEEWWMVRRMKTGKEGVVPSSYIEVTGAIIPQSSSGINAGRSTVEQNRLEEQRLAKEALRASKEEDNREVGPGMRLPERGSSLMARDNGNISTKQPRSKSDNSKNGKSKPDPSKVRTWTDRSKSFSVEAQFLALKDGKINLHKANGVKIAVPVVKMSVEDLEYVERVTGVSLDEDKPLSDIKRQRSRAANDRPKQRSGATVDHTKPEYDWFQFFLSCDVSVALCERYSQVFNRDNIDETVLPDIESSVLRTLGIKEGDIIKIMRTLDARYRPGKGKRNEAEGEGGLFSGAGGALHNNTRKGRPAPPVQTNDVVDADAFKNGESPKKPADSTETPLASAPKPAEKKESSGGFDDDAWDVKPARSQPTPPPAAPVAQPVPVPAPAPAPVQQPTLTAGMQDLSLLSQPLPPPLEPIKAQPTAPAPAPAPVQPQVPQQTGATPSFFAGVAAQNTGMQPLQTGAPQMSFGQQQTPQSIARQRPIAPGITPGVNGLMPPPPARPLSAPQTQQQSAFSVPPLQPQMTGYQSSGGFQPQIAPPGQSLNDLNNMRMQQQFNQQQQQMQQQMQPQQTGFGQPMMPQQTGQFNGTQQPNGFGQPMPPQQTGFGQNPQFMNGQQTGSPFADPRGTQPFQPMQQQPTGFQSSFQPQQQFPQATGVNSFLPPALQPQQTGMQPQQTGMNGFGQNFIPPPIPPMPQQQTATPLVPQKTGPPPPVRFGVTGDTKKLMPQATGRRANLAQATPQNPFGF